MTPWRRVPARVWLLCLLAAVASVALGLTVFRHGSLNNDEGVYLLQAELLRGGHLTLDPVPGHVEASQPWLFALRDGEFAGKYLPVVPGLLAAGLAAFGSIVPVLALLAAALPLAVWSLARRCGLPPPRATVAAAVVSLSPLVLVQSALALSYLPFLLLAVVAWDRALAVLSGGRGWVVLGVATSAAFGARPFDAVVLLGPAVAWALWRAAWRGRALFGFGALPLAVVTLLYNAAVTGSPLRLPFDLLEPSDTLGFGDRRLFPEDTTHGFGPLQSVAGLARHFAVGGSAWTLLPVAVTAVVLATPAARRALSRGPLGWVVGSSLALPVAYLGFWGPYHASVLWDGTDTVGAFYAMPLLPAIGLVVASLGLPRRRAATVVVVAALVTNVTQAAFAVVNAHAGATRTGTLLRLADEARAVGTLLLDTDPPYLGHPVSALRNAPGERSVLLANALDSVPPGARLLQIPGDVYSPGGYGYSMREVETFASPAPVLSVRHVGFRNEVMVVSRLGRAWACAGSTARIEVTAGGIAGCTGATLPPEIDDYRMCRRADCVSVSFHREIEGEPFVMAWRWLPLVRSGNTWVVPVDGRVVEQSGRGWIEVTRG